MRKWWKKSGVLAGGLMGLAGLLSPVHAQFGIPGPDGPGGVFPGAPQPPQAPDFPNPSVPPSEPVSPFTLTNDGSPNAWTDGGPPASTGYRFSLRAEYLNWWVPGINVPIPVVTSSTAPNVNNNFGALGQANTVTVFGGQSYDYRAVLGGRLTLGMATGIVPPIEVSGLSFNRNLNLFSATSDGSPNSSVLARPLNLLTVPNILGGPSAAASVIAFPGFGGGGISVESHLNLWAFDADMLIPLTDNGVIQIDFLFGYKYAELRESLNIAESYTIPGSQFNNLAGGVPAGFTTGIIDNFAAGNRFNGGTVGLRSRFNYSAFTLITDARVALGNNRELYNATGTSSLSGGGSSLSLPGGLLALNSNSGTTSRNTFTAIPELNLTLSCQLTGNIRVFAGYNILYWSNVIRAGDQLSINLDPRQIPTDRNFVPNFTGTGPNSTFITTSFFGHGFNVGLEVGF
jgi:hypothetical protein